MINKFNPIYLISSFSQTLTIFWLWMVSCKTWTAPLPAWSSQLMVCPPSQAETFTVSMEGSRRKMMDWVDP